MDMGGDDDVGEELPVPPARLFERLAHIRGYIWDQSQKPFHSVCFCCASLSLPLTDLFRQSYDNWHVLGIQQPLDNFSSSSSSGRPSFGRRSTTQSDDTGPSEVTSDTMQGQEIDGNKLVVARLSTHTLRLEREYQLCKSLIESADPNCEHTVRPLEFVRLPGQQENEEPYVVSIFESLGPNFLQEMVDIGPAVWNPGDPVYTLQNSGDDGDSPRNKVSLSVILEFAVGATECLSVLHHGYHGLRLVHGELRADAFHFNRETGAVRLINYGSGLRSFENGLTSARWSSLSREAGIKNKLRFVAPEQTGRMPAEPDSRTDIYSLGILFWTVLTGFPAVDGETPMDIIQSVLGRRIPPVTSKRIDIPDSISGIIQKMTQKQIG